ncbi:flagellar protein FlaG [Vogesella indigofera]|uniref:flagellar protein FlaG n=1 Tax=Vogesella indigofera TaxID=45465 RepID=UPI00234F9D0D|nr:flagellar protein FlaG [Vogesella indigofera]MDC7711166.1 flagellar protein FlaG [Vogesella indigofera]
MPVSAGAVQALSSAAAGAQGKNVLDKEELAQATEKISKLVATFASELNFSIDEDLGVPIVKVIDKQTDKVIRQIPTEEVLELSKNLDKLVGVLYQSKA